MTPQPDAQQVLRLAPAQLKTHPANMRRRYPAADVRRMAESIMALGGLIHPMRVVPDGQAGTYYVVDGNMRLAGARLLGSACPPLDCLRLDADHAQQLLAMAAANVVRFDVDPISEALHFQRLRAEGLTHLAIAERTGVQLSRVTLRLKLLQYDPEIQELVADGQWPVSHEIADAFAAIPEAVARIKLARRLVEQGASNRAILAAARKLAEHYANPRSKVSRKLASHPRPRPDPAPARPALSLAQERTGLGLPSGEARSSWVEVRAAARAMCERCDIRVDTLRAEVAEPAWAQIAHAAGETCQNCNLRDVAAACQACPGVEMLSRLVRSAHGH